MLEAAETVLKNQICITVSHVKGSHQVGVKKQTIKAVLAFSLLMLLAMIIYPWWLNYFNQELIERNQSLKLAEQQLEARNKQLNAEQQQLQQQIEQQQHQLSMSEYQLDSLFDQINFPGIDTFDNPAKFNHTSYNLALRQVMMRLIPNGRPTDYDRVTSSFGHRIHPVEKKKHLHTGIDVHAFVGTPVIATADGVVSTTQNTASGFGKLIKVNHGMGFVTYYGHLDSIKVKKGQVVSKGEVIGLSGNTGRSTGPHLHYEVRYGNKPLNPAYFILMTLSNYETQLTKIKEVPWGSLTANMQKRIVAPQPPSSPLIATSTEPSTLTEVCTSTGTCQDVSSAMVQQP